MKVPSPLSHHKPSTTMDVATLILALLALAFAARFAGLELN
jgi:hypothetical protein